MVPRASGGPANMAAGWHFHGHGGRAEVGRRRSGERTQKKLPGGHARPGSFNFRWRKETIFVRVSPRAVMRLFPSPRPAVGVEVAPLGSADGCDQRPRNRLAKAESLANESSGSVPPLDRHPLVGDRPSECLVKVLILRRGGVKLSHSFREVRTSLGLRKLAVIDG